MPWYTNRQLSTLSTTYHPEIKCYTSLWLKTVQLLVPGVVKVCSIEDGTIILLSNAVTPPTSRHGVITMETIVNMHFKYRNLFYYLCEGLLFGLLLSRRT